ncbi:MAG: hypothetical protein K6A65_02240 [Succinivibrionaceae bacterium]|nr:hypothetical protein [Succinivibrionaceae bacterium]
MQKRFLALALAGLLACPGLVCAKGAHEGAICVVDVPKIMAESAPSALGRKHIEDVQKSLQARVKEVEQAWAKGNEQQRAAAMNDALLQLNRQLEFEKMAVNRQIVGIIQEEAGKWRAKSKARMVMPKEALLAVDPSMEITSEILDLVNKRTPKFGELPKITVKQPKFDEKGNLVEVSEAPAAK